MEEHHQLNFLVVINPNSGPGPLPYPSNDYSPQVQRLNAYPNVQTVGYVRTGYATRNISTVLEEIATYAGWSSNTTDFAMHGIFFDEAPHQYSADAVDFMTKVNKAVKEESGILGDKTVRIGLAA